jgi:ketosteroid isomerase-like protein
MLIKERPLENTDEVAATIIAMERAALDRWEKGDPGGFLEICAPDVVYFDPYQQQRINGLEELTALYKSIWGMVHADGYEWIDPRVQLCGDMAVLTFNHITLSGEKRIPWNCTEVYRRDNGVWRIIQTHWSYTGVGSQIKF